MIDRYAIVDSIANDETIDGCSVYAVAEATLDETVAAVIGSLRKAAGE